MEELRRPLRETNKSLGTCLVDPLKRKSALLYNQLRLSVFSSFLMQILCPSLAEQTDSDIEQRRIARLAELLQFHTNIECVYTAPMNYREAFRFEVFLFTFALFFNFNTENKC